MAPGKILLKTLLIFIIIISALSPSKEESADFVNEISMIIEGSSLKILYAGYNEIPSEVFINGEEARIQNNEIQFQNNLETEKNNITLRWNKTILDCSYMFYNLVNIISIDLSNFDLSSVISTEKMFYYCKNLRNIIFPKDTTITNIESM